MTPRLEDLGWTVIAERVVSDGEGAFEAVDVILSLAQMLDPLPVDGKREN